MKNERTGNANKNDVIEDILVQVLTWLELNSTMLVAGVDINSMMPEDGTRLTVLGTKIVSKMFDADLRKPIQQCCYHIPWK